MRVRVLTTAAAIVASLTLGVLPASAITSAPDATAWMANGFVKASVQYGNVMFIGGDFQRLGESVPPGPSTGPFVDGYTGLAAIDMTTGRAISTFKPQLTANANQTRTVFALAMVGNRLYVGGQFATVDGEAHYNLAAIDINPTTLQGTVVSSFDPIVGVPGASNEGNFEVRTILPGPDGLYIGGAFSKVDGKGRPKTAKLDFDSGDLINAYKTAGVNGIVHDMVRAADGNSIFLAGGFKQLGSGNTRYAMGRIDPTTGATLPWTVPSGDIPGSTTSGQICYELAVTATRLFAGCGKKPNFVGAFRLDNGNTGNRTWQYGTGGNVQTVNLLPNGNDLVIGGHFGINSSSTYNGLMRVCGSQYLRAVGIIRNVTNPTGTAGVITTGSTSTVQPYLDCSFLPNIDGRTPAGPNYSGINRYGGLWEIQVTDSYLWALGEFRYVNAQVRRSIARFSWDGSGPPPPPPPVEPVLAELATASPLAVLADRTLSFTLRCPDQPDPCNGTVKLGAGGSKQFGPQAFALAPLQEQTFVATLNDGAWNKIHAKSNHQIGGKLTLTAEGSPGTTPTSDTISVKLKLAS